jgi:hypothetical protein
MPGFLAAGPPTDNTPEVDMQHALATMNWPRVFQLALAHGATVLAVPCDELGGDTALHAAAGLGQVDVVHTLIDCGADVNIRRRGDKSTPLHVAAFCDEAGAVRALLERGADIEAVDDESGVGCSPLHVAAGAGCTRAARALIKAGADRSEAYFAGNVSGQYDEYDVINLLHSEDVERSQQGRRRDGSDNGRPAA